jgi:hypothetical protein
MAKSEPFLTVGMPTYDDYDGVFFSIQALRMYNESLMDNIEILVIDNNPDGKHGKLIRTFIKNNVPNGRYVPEKEWQGPWVKDLVMREAAGKYSMCMDCHILLAQGALKKLVEFYAGGEKNWVRSPQPGVPHPQDFFQGPLVYDNLKSISTHFEPTWRGEMWGIWSNDQRGNDPDGPAFEIPMQGMGLFTCAKKSWEEVGGFNRLMKGFGGEEGYIHAKFRQAGRRCWCLPFLRWMHRFNRPHGVPFVLTWENKVWNYTIAFLECGLPLNPMIDHFTESKGKGMRSKIMAVVNEAMIAYQAANNESEPEPPPEDAFTKEDFVHLMGQFLVANNQQPTHVTIPTRLFPAIRDWGGDDKPDVPENISIIYGCQVDWVDADTQVMFS